MASAYKLECVDCEEPGQIILEKAAAVTQAEVHHEATGHAVTVRDVFGEFEQEPAVDD